MTDRAPNPTPGDNADDAPANAHTDHNSHHPDAHAPHDEHFEDLIHAVLEGPHDDPARLGLIKAIKQDQAAMRELRLAQGTIAELRRPVAVPDFATQVLERTHQRRAFIPKPMRTWVDRGRLATAAALLLALTGFTAFQRLWPDATRLASAPRPVSDVPSAFLDDATVSAGVLVNGVEQARAALLPIPPEQHAALFDETPDPARALEAFILQSTGPDGARSDYSILFFDRTAPREHSLRLLRVPAPPPTTPAVPEGMLLFQSDLPLDPVPPSGLDADPLP